MTLTLTLQVAAEMVPPRLAALRSSISVTHFSSAPPLIARLPSSRLRDRFTSIAPLKTRRTHLHKRNQTLLLFYARKFQGKPRPCVEYGRGRRCRVRSSEGDRVQQAAALHRPVGPGGHGAAGGDQGQPVQSCAGQGAVARSRLLVPEALLVSVQNKVAFQVKAMIGHHKFFFPTKLHGYLKLGGS